MFPTCRFIRLPLPLLARRAKGRSAQVGDDVLDERVERVKRGSMIVLVGFVSAWRNARWLLVVGDAEEEDCM